MSARELRIEAPELRLDPEATLRGLRWEETFGQAGNVEIEIGIGKGRFLLATAVARPESNYLGVEWANHYLRIAERRALKQGLKNIRFVRLDARELVRGGIPATSVSVYYVFYPDPWPKKRHQKRRFLQKETIDHLARTLVPGGRVHVATDHDEYWSAIAPLFDLDPRFARLSGFGGEDFSLPPDVPLTNFEEKYLPEGRSRHRGSWLLTSLNSRGVDDTLPGTCGS